MKKKRIGLVGTAMLLAALLCLSLGIVAEASFGSGVAVIADKTEIIKTAIAGGKVVFSDLDIKQGLCITDFDEIRICSIPASNEGTLMLAGRRVGVGTVIKRKNIGALVFIPAGKDVGECKFTFTTDAFADGAEIDFIIKFTDKVNYSPEISSATANAAAISTQRDVSVYGRMSATDTEGDALEYIVIKYPSVGSVKVIDANSGEFVYTPPDGYVGDASFTYVARDEWGNYSKPCEVSVSIVERQSEVVYADMTEREEYNAAVALTALGAVDGRIIGGGVYFCPDDAVTKAEFTVMAMKCAGISPDTSLTSVYFDDSDEIAAPMMPYIATAARLGIISGYFDGAELLFSPNSQITAYEAAMIMAALADPEDDVAVSAESAVGDCPVWASDAVSKMLALGIFSGNAEEADAARALTKAECTSYLYKMMQNG